MTNSEDHSIRPVGLTQSVGYQIGVRRTLRCSKEVAWTYLTSMNGLASWLACPNGLVFEQGALFGQEDATYGEVRVIRVQEQIRMTWYMPDWSRASTLQIRLIGVRPSATTVSIHQEHLDDGDIRQAMKVKWEQALADMSEHIARG